MGDFIEHWLDDDVSYSTPVVAKIKKDFAFLPTPCDFNNQTEWVWLRNVWYYEETNHGIGIRSCFLSESQYLLWKLMN